MSKLTPQRLEYRDAKALALPAAQAVTPSPPPAAPPGFTEQQVLARIEAALLQAEQTIEQRWAARAEQAEAQRRKELSVTLQAFAAERERYFRNAEAEVVHLALAISRKILGREAKLDPELLLGLVRVALDRMETGSAIRIRVPPADLALWKQTEVFAGAQYTPDLIPDPAVLEGQCILETDLGTADFGVQTQFKEIEQGMLDLLDLRSRIQVGQSHSISATTSSHITERFPEPVLAGAR